MRFRPLALLGAAALPLALGAYVRVHETRTPVAVPTVTMIARDYAIDGPDSLPSGAVTLRLLSRGKELHHLWIARLEGGRTVADLLDSVSARRALPAWAHQVGGPNAPAPGGEARATVTLAAGNYVVACLIPAPTAFPTS